MGNGWFESSGGPKAPENGHVTSPFVVGAWDIRWDDPSLLCENEGIQVLGVNIYRSEASDRGPYRRINRYPIGGSFYRDVTTNTLVEREIVDWDSAYLSKGDSPNNPAWIFCTRHPIVKQGDIRVDVNSRGGQRVFSDSISDVEVTINGHPVTVIEVFGRNREVHLLNKTTINPITERRDVPIIPGPDDEVLVTYYTNTNYVRTDLGNKSFYRLTTVAANPEGPGLVETPLRFSQPLNSHEVESLDWIWKEAIRRNLWVLQQGGERVKVFVKKTSGITCGCAFDSRTQEYTDQPNSRCLKCFGTGILGGYEGPYDIILAPDDAERRINQTEWGRHLEHTYEVWTTPYPVLTQRDLIVKQTNERYSIGPVRRPSNRGMNLQQHFNIAHIDESDIRYKIPVNGTQHLAWPETRTTDDIVTGDPCYMRHNFEGQSIPTGPDLPGATPMGTEKDNIPDGREQRGRTPVWENTTY